MKRISHFSGLEAGSLGLKLPEYLTADLPTAADSTGVQVIITDNGVGDDEYAVVVSNGTAWTLTTGAALT